MLEKRISKIEVIKDENKARKKEKARLLKEKTEEETRTVKERIKAEKDKLLGLSEKALMVDILMELREMKAHLNTIQENQSVSDKRSESFTSSIKNLDSRLASIAGEISSLNLNTSLNTLNNYLK